MARNAANVMGTRKGFAKYNAPTTRKPNNNNKTGFCKEEEVVMPAVVKRLCLAAGVD